MSHGIIENNGEAIWQIASPEPLVFEYCRASLFVEMLRKAKASHLGVRWQSAAPTPLWMFHRRGGDDMASGRESPVHPKRRGAVASRRTPRAAVCTDQSGKSLSVLSTKHDAWQYIQIKSRRCPSVGIAQPDAIECPRPRVFRILGIEELDRLLCGTLHLIDSFPRCQILRALQEVGPGQRGNHADH
jgi:hypothetical protein